MELRFKNSKIKKQCEDPKRAQRDFGLRMGTVLTQRVAELWAATCLLDLKFISAARLHRLKGDRKYQYAVDLVNPYRLVFEPLLQDGVEIWDLDRIDIIRIEQVVNYHGK